MKYPLYLLYSLMLVGTASLAEYRGWGSSGVNRLTGVPKTVRDNPGAYRSHYGFYPRYVGGK